MSRDQVQLRRVPSEEGFCPVPELLVRHRLQGGAGEWWAGTLLEPPSRVVSGPAGRLDLLVPGRLADADDAYRFSPFGAQPRVTGTVEGRHVEGDVEQPGTRGFLKNLTAVSRERRRVRLRLTDGREWWLRATGAATTQVTTADGRTVGRWAGGPFTLAADGSALDHLVALLLITGIERGDLLTIGTFA